MKAVASVASASETVCRNCTGRKNASWPEAARSRARAISWRIEVWSTSGKYLSASFSCQVGCMSTTCRLVSIIFVCRAGAPYPCRMRPSQVRRLHGSSMHRSKLLEALSSRHLSHACRSTHGARNSAASAIAVDSFTVRPYGVMQSSGAYTCKCFARTYLDAGYASVRLGVCVLPVF